MSEEPVHPVARSVGRIVRVEQHDTPPHSTQDQCGGKSGGTAADDGDVEGSVIRTAHQPFTASNETLLTPYLSLASRARSEMNS